MRRGARWIGVTAFACWMGEAEVAAAEPDEGQTAAIERFRQSHRRTQLVGMGVLTGWAVANIGVGIGGAVLIDDDRRFVHEMNAMWNTVNLTLGIIGLVSNGRRAPGVTTQAEARRVHRRARITYAVNGALDLVYISGGVLAAELGRQHDQGRVRGYGKSVVLQGAFLFVFDLGMLIAHERVAARVPALRLVPSVSQSGIGLVASGSFSPRVLRTRR